MAKLLLRSKMQTFLNQGNNSVSFYIKQPQIVVRLFAPEICEIHKNWGSWNLRKEQNVYLNISLW